ncbi:hypothetical protein BC827DRAFT_442335 [Russula dissimulans]|nr:hypothetical protein BC827DRAFT_442335 [Russula dissimulans]
MNQSDMGNSSGAQPEGNPYGLQRGVDGWSLAGSNENFGLRLNIIKIKHSDANRDNMPTEEERKKTVDQQGNFSQHVLLGPGDDTYKLWMEKTGPYLGHWVLGKSLHVSPPWKLLKFPEGYTLWLHKTGSITDPANPRTDAYLHGAPHLGPHNGRSQGFPTVFRSPMEFVEHAIWLMKGGAGSCLCKYCQPGQSQNDINSRLDPLGRERAPDDDDGGSGDSRRGRGGGPGSQARRVRRAKRERSPAIMAKDYRVGNRGA